MTRVLFIFGTRPEAIKLCPVVRQMRSQPERFDARVCVTAQHRELLDQVLDVFAVRTDHDLNVMTPGQSLFSTTARIVASLEGVFATERPDVVLVQGDTTTTFCGALAAFYARVPVGHVEAGLRSGDREQPYPEEVNRVLTGHLADLHFAPTEGAARNLLAEGIASDRVFVTGNTGIDAVLQVAEGLEQGRLKAPEWPWPVGDGRRLVLVTAHRRESFGDGIVGVCEALQRIASRPDVRVVFPVHPNPNVTGPVRERLGGFANVHLVEPLPYVSFVDLMRRADVILTDSGGIQEEAPSLGKPVLVMRNTTERPEGMEVGAARLVGTETGRVAGEVERVLGGGEMPALEAVHRTYGDGRSSGRICDLIHSFYGKNKFRRTLQNGAASGVN